MPLTEMLPRWFGRVGL